MSLPLTQSFAQRLIAHRGYSQCYPENTLAALAAALQLGAHYVEFDVQFTADKLPVLFHDSELTRITGVAGDIQQMTSVELAQLRAKETDRFGEQFVDEPIPTLAAVLQHLSQWPQVNAFVEIKDRTVEKFGVEYVARRMVEALAPYQHNCILISFDRAVLEAARREGMQRIGWVISSWDKQSHEQAENLSPDVLFCNYKKIPDVEAVLWPGSWAWALYDVVDAEVAMQWFARGAGFIETWDIGAMLNDPRLSSTKGQAGKACEQ